MDTKMIQRIQIWHTLLLDLLTDSIDQLPEKEKLVVSLYYNEEATMQEISLILGITVGRVSQLHSSAIIRLRDALQSSEQ